MVTWTVPTVTLLIPRTEARHTVQPKVDNVSEPSLSDNIGTV